MKSITKRIAVASLLSLAFCFHAAAQVQLEGIVIEDPVAGPIIQDPINQSAFDQAPTIADSTVEELPPATQAIMDGLTDAINSAGTVAPVPELVTERYDNRKVKTEREVIQDQEQNYINHGKWKTYDQKGNAIVEGRYKYAEMDGVWTRVYYQRDNELLNKAPFNQGQLPLVSQANFKDGKLHGKWVIYDAQKRRLCEWEFTNGKRDGRSTWWYASGPKMREINYRSGTIDGQLNEWDRNGRQVTKHIYDEGSRIASKTEHFPNRAKRAEGTVRYPKLVLDTPDNWLDCTLATYTQEGEPVKHGRWVSWFANGQTKLEGEYNNDVPVGKFTWWHDNGQRSLVAEYRNGKKHGVWTWWHPSGLKSIQGEYDGNSPVSKWIWWETSGKVAQKADFNDPAQRQKLAIPQQDNEFTTITTPTTSRVRPRTLLRK